MKNFLEVLFDIFKILALTLFAGYMAWGWSLMQ
jgi:hypothetical protein